MGPGDAVGCRRLRAVAAVAGADAGAGLTVSRNGRVLCTTGSGGRPPLFVAFQAAGLVFNEAGAGAVHSITMMGYDPVPLGRVSQPASGVHALRFSQRRARVGRQPHTQARLAVAKRLCSAHPMFWRTNVTPLRVPALRAVAAVWRARPCLRCSVRRRSSHPLVEDESLAQALSAVEHTGGSVPWCALGVLWCV